MSDAYILRAGKRVLTLNYTSDKRLVVEGAGADSRPLRVLRREPGGLIVVLWGDHVFSGIVSGNGDTFDLTISGEGGNLEKGLALKPAAIDAMEQVVSASANATGPLPINSPIPGLIKSVKVKAGDEVAEGQTVVVLEAMKMENEIPAPRAGTVQSVEVQPGQTVAAGLLLVTLAALA